MTDPKNKNSHERDDVTGIETTGHEWDGIKELNRPAPRWWLWVFLITVIWSIWYWAVYPAWPVPGGHTQGSKGWTQFSQLAESQGEIRARKAGYLEKFHAASFDDIKNNPELYAFAIAGGAAAFKDNCATCHGTGGAGSAGYPNLNDDDWLWGGTTDAIYQTIRFGIRSGHEQAEISEMPAFSDMLNREQVKSVANYVLSLSGKTVATPEGTTLFAEQCAVCHGDSGRGSQELGAPNLADAIWFYGNDAAAISAQIQRPRHGVMPHWVDRLDDDTIRQLTIYVHSLGGGE